MYYYYHKDGYEIGTKIILTENVVLMHDAFLVKNKTTLNLQKGTLGIITKINDKDALGGCYDSPYVIKFDRVADDIIGIPEYLIEKQ